MSKEKASTSEERLEELQQGTLAAPKDSELCLTLGEAFLRVNMVDEAAASYQRAVELDPRSDLKALYWEWLGLVREMEGRLEEALEAYFQWLDADPVAISPLDRLGTLLVVLGRWTDLKLLGPQFERRIEVSGHPRARESLALYTFVIEQFGQTEKEAAREVTLSALEADPDSPSMRFLLGLLTYRDGQLELAQGEFERVLQLDSEGLWHEPRFALDWNSSKARVMVAKLSRQQGDVETALRLLSEADDLDQSDSEGLVEVAELLVENHRYDELLHLLDQITPGPSRLDRLRAESFLGKGRITEAARIYEVEARIFQDGEEEGDTEDSFARVNQQLEELWNRHQRGEAVDDELIQLRREDRTAVEQSPMGAGLILLQRIRTGALDGDGGRQEIQSLSRKFPNSVAVWEACSQASRALEDPLSTQLTALVASKLRHGSQPGPSGSFTSNSRRPHRVLVGVFTDVGPLVVSLEADVGREDKDQLFGWGRECLLPGLELAKGVLEGLAEGRGGARETIPELTFFPKSFRVMITPVIVPSEGGPPHLLLSGELGSIPFGFLVALLSVVRDTEFQQTLVLGRLGLRGDIDGVAQLEETLMTIERSGEVWDRLLLAEAGAFRLLRVPAWLWHDRTVQLVNSAAQLAGWPTDRHQNGSVLR